MPTGAPEKVAEGRFKVDSRYIYFVDRDGDVARARREPVRKKPDEATRKEARELLYTLFPYLDVPKSTNRIQFVQDQATRIFKLVADRDDLDRLTPRELEELLAEVFSRYRRISRPESEHVKNRVARASGGSRKPVE